jgi:hypothetical protein
MRNKEWREGGKCQVLVLDHGNQGLFIVWTCYFRGKILVPVQLSIGEITKSLDMLFHGLLIASIPESWSIPIVMDPDPD